MSLPSKTSYKIEELLIKTVENKLKSYDPETNYMPFHHRLLGKDRYATFSLIQSMNTTFGISLWEQISVILARSAGYHAERQYRLLGQIDNDAEKIINEIHNQLRKGKIIPNKSHETEQIRKIIKNGRLKPHPDSVVDLFVKIEDKENYFDITSAKPNIKEFVILKHKLLNWIALRLSQNNNVNIFTRLAIPYNPYHPEPYTRWTERGLFDLECGEILVGEEFWNFIAGIDVYKELLNIFHIAGEKLRER